MSSATSGNVPDGWGTDKLTEFFDMARGNTLASFVQMRSDYARLHEIDSAYLLIGENLLNPPDVFTPLFLLKTHSSYRAAAQLAMAGQSPEAFMVMRGCLESALYGLHIHCNNAALEIWKRRHEDAQARKHVRKEFTIARLWECLRAVDEDLQRRTQILYEKTIDFGAHPNAASITSVVTMSAGDTGVQFRLAYLSAELEVIRGTMKSVAQVGIVGLCIFRHIFRERYDILGLTDTLPALRCGL